MAKLKYFVLAFVWIASIFTSGIVNAQGAKTDYRAVVGMNSASFNFKSAQVPTNLQTVALGTTYAVKRIDYEVFSDSFGRLKFFLPPGTVAFNANLYYYLAPQEGKVALRLYELPQMPLSQISGNHAGGPLNETVLQNLIDEQEIFYYTAGAPANSMVLSSPDNPIAPVAKGGYLYGNFQYPGELLQRGLLQVFVKADCYEQWFNSPSTKWDISENPDENVEHTCAGSSGGNVEPLQDILLYPGNTLQVGSAVPELTISPNPSGAALPICTVEQNLAHVFIADNKIKLLPSADNLTTSTVQTIVCGSIRKTITILPANQLQKSSSIDQNGNLLINLKLMRTQADIFGKTTVDFWVAARIPANGFFFREDKWFFLTDQGWRQLTELNVESAVYKDNQPVKLEEVFNIPIGLTTEDLGAFDVEIHFGYRDARDDFKNLGVIWSKN